MKYLWVCVVVMVSACGGGRHPVTGDAMAGGDARVDAASDASTDGSPDAPDAGLTCAPPGKLNRVSIDTSPQTKLPLVTSAGGTTMVAWGVYPNGVTLDRAAWAQLQGTTVIAHGTFASGITTASATLFALGSTYYLFSPPAGLISFDGSDWTPIAGFTASRIVISGSRVFGLSTTTTSTTVVTFDGTTVGAAAQVGSFALADAVGDGAGGLGIVMNDASGFALHFVTGDGTTWSTDSTVATGTVTWQQVRVAYSGAQWGVSALSLSAATPHTWLRGATTWDAADSGLASMSAFVGNGSAFLLVSSNGKLAVYKASTWTTTTLTTGGTSDVQAAAIGAGYVVYDHGTAVVFDGAAWSPEYQSNTLVGSPFVIAGTTAAIGTSTSTLLYSNGSWSWGAGGDALAFAGTDLVAASVHWTAPGTATLLTGLFTTVVPTTLPQYATSGTVSTAFVERGANGGAFAIWTQYDDGVLKGFATTYDCATWYQPVPVPLVQDAYRVAATDAGGYVVADVASRHIDGWQGASVAQLVATGTSPMVSSDGPNAIALWQSGTTIEYTATADLNTWPAAQSLDTGSLVGITGGNGSVIAWWLSGANVVARVWHNGTWSDARALASVYSTSCRASVAGASAVVACTSTANGAALDIELYDGAAWTTVSTGSGAFVLGTDGSDYRLEYGLRSASPMSTVLHAGTWSAPAADTSANTAAGVAGRAGAWDLVATSGTQYVLDTATGAGAFGASQPIGPLPVVTTVPDPFSRIPGHTDAAFIEAHPLQYRGIAALYVALDL